MVDATEACCVRVYAASFGANLYMSDYEKFTAKEGEVRRVEILVEKSQKKKGSKDEEAAT